ncbi:MAG: hypothetical protein N2651_05955 [Fimbriimonadales bacterium]|nr:hypothetical protein [Fimbriimonadales bacterium]
MQRTLLWGWFFLALGVAAAQSDANSLEQRITFREPAQRVQTILQTLSKHAGVRLIAAREVQDEIVLVDAESLPLRQVMDSLALALDAEWFPLPDGSYRLARPVKRALQRQAFENERIIKFWREELRKRAPDQLEHPLTETEVRATLRRLRDALREAMGRPEERRQLLNRTNFYEPLYQISPVRRFLHRLVSQIDLSEVVQIPVGEQRIYSNRPGAYLHPFRKSVDPLIQQFLREASLVSALYRDANDGVADLMPLFREQFLYDPFGNALRVDVLENLEYPIVYLIMSRNDAPDLEITLIIQRPSDLKAEELITSTVSLYRFRNSLNLPSEIAWREAPVALSEKARLMLTTLAWTNWGFFLPWTKGVEEDTNLPERFRTIDPAAVEPLSLAATDVLRAYARARQKPIVALILDSETFPYDADYEFVNPNATLRLGVLEMYLAQWEWIEGSVLVAKPEFASYTWNRRYPRDVPNKIIEQVKRRGYFTGDDYLLALRLTPDAKSLNEAWWWFEVNGVQAYRFDQEDVRLLDKMGTAIWRRLLQGETLRVTDLPPIAVKQLHYMAYQATYGGIEVSVSSNSDNLIPAFFYPDGIPPTTQIRLIKETDTGFFQTYRNGIWSDFDSLHTVKWILQRNDEHLQYDYYSYRRRFLKVPSVQYATEIEYVLELIPSDPSGVKLTIWLPNWYELIGKPTRWNEPPKEAKEAFDEVLRTDLDDDDP